MDMIHPDACNSDACKASVIKKNTDFNGMHMLITYVLILESASVCIAVILLSSTSSTTAATATTKLNQEKQTQQVHKFKYYFDNSLTKKV